MGEKFIPKENQEESIGNKIKKTTKSALVGAAVFVTLAAGKPAGAETKEKYQPLTTIKPPIKTKYSGKLPRERTFNEYLAQKEKEKEITKTYYIDFDNDGQKEKININFQNENAIKSSRILKNLEINQNLNHMEINSNYGTSDYYSEIIVRNNNNKIVFSTAKEKPLSSGDGFFINTDNEIIVIQRELGENLRTMPKLNYCRYEAIYYKFNPKNTNYEIFKKIKSKKSYLTLKEATEEFDFGNFKYRFDSILLHNILKNK